MRCFVKQVLSPSDPVVRASHVLDTTSPFLVVSIDGFRGFIDIGEAMCFLDMLFFLAPESSSLLFARLDVDNADHMSSKANSCGLHVGCVRTRGHIMPFVVVQHMNRRRFAELLPEVWSTSAAAGHWVLVSLPIESPTDYTANLIGARLQGVQRLHGSLFSLHSVVGVSFDDSLVDILVRDRWGDSRAVGEELAAVGSASNVTLVLSTD